MELPRRDLSAVPHQGRLFFIGDNDLQEDGESGDDAQGVQFCNRSDDSEIVSR
jgi:hypothetical protein